MKIKMLTLYAGPKMTCQRGKSIDLPEKEAQALVDGGYALHVLDKPRAVEKKPESADPNAGRGNDEKRAGLILDAVQMILEEVDDSKLIASGAPKVDVLEDLLGFDITSAERDIAFDQVR